MAQFSAQALTNTGNQLNLVRVTNPSNGKDFKGKWDGQTYVIPAGGETLVPYAAMCNWGGNPEARDLNPRQRNRVEEFKRIRTKYGAYDDDKKWERNKPTLEYHTLDGDRIPTVLDDPDGNNTEFTFGDETTDASVGNKMAAMEAQLNEIQAMLADGRLVVNMPAVEGVESTRPPIEESETGKPAPSNGEVGGKSAVTAPKPSGKATTATAPKSDDDKSDTEPPEDGPDRVKVTPS